MVSVLPYAAGLFIEGGPAPEMRDTSRLVAAFDSPNGLLNALQRHRMLDDAIVFSQLARRQVDEWTHDQFITRQSRQRLVSGSNAKSVLIISQIEHLRNNLLLGFLECVAIKALPDALCRVGCRSPARASIG